MSSDSEFLDETSTVGDESEDFMMNIGAEGITVAWDSISYVVNKGKKKEKTILDGISGVAAPGEVVGLLGPSGAGKTSLLNILANRVNGYDGLLSANGNDVRSHQAYFKRNSAYVMQTDALMGPLTVRENVMYSCKFGTNGISNAERKERTQHVIDEMGLSHVSESKVGNVIIRGISGGERKRTSVAVELVKYPKMLFLDEPTTGLDSTATYQVMQSIKTHVKSKNLTMIASIHMPSMSVFDMFDKVIFLSKGKMMYYGPPRDIPKFIRHDGFGQVPKSINLPELVLDLTNDDFQAMKEDRDVPTDERLSEQCHSHFKDSPWHERVEKELEMANDLHDEEANNKLSIYARSLPAQIGILTQRNLLNALRYVALYWVRVAMYVALALLMGIVWWDIKEEQEKIQDRFGVYFFSVAFLSFMAVAAIPALIEDRVIFERERSNSKYSTLAYLTSTTMISSIFVLIIALSFSAIAYPMIGLNPDGDAFGRFVLFLYLALMVSESMMVMLSAAIPYFIIALTLGAGANGFFMVVQGFFIRKDSLPEWFEWTNYLSYQKYSFEAIMVSDLVSGDGYTFACDPIPGTQGCFCMFQPEIATACEFTGRDIVREYGYDEVDYNKYVGVLVGMIAFFRILTYVVMVVRAKWCMR